MISRKAFNEHTGFAIVAPITSTVRGIRLEVELEGVKTQGAVLIYQLKSLDFENRDIELIEQAQPATINAHVLATVPLPAVVRHQGLRSWARRNP